MAKLNGAAPNNVEPNPALRSSLPSARQQLAAVAKLRWRVFVNSLQTTRGRVELGSRIFIALAFMAGGLGGDAT